MKINPIYKDLQEKKCNLVIFTKVWQNWTPATILIRSH